MNHYLVLLGKYSFYLHLYIGGHFVFFNSKKRKLYWLFAVLGLFVGLPLYWFRNVYVLNFDISYIVSLVAVGSIFFLCYEMNFLSLLNGLVTTFCLQHFAHNLNYFIDNYWLNGDTAVENVFAIIFFLLINVGLAFGYFWVAKKKRISFETNSISLIIIIASLIAFIVVFILTNIKGLNNSYTRIYTSLCVFLVIAVQFGVYTLGVVKEENLKLKYEKANLENAINLNYRYNELYEKSINDVEIQYHNMKKELEIIKKLDESSQKEYFENIQQTVDQYTLIAKTGNHVLDIVLSRAKMVCNLENINFTYIVDGNSVNFISKPHIVGLFNNLLDNAIQASRKEKFKVIKLNVSVVEHFLRISCENYFTKEVKFKDGIPLTTNEEKQNHGIGSKAICYIVDQYDGSTIFTHRNDIFSVNIAIPIKEIEK